MLCDDHLHTTDLSPDSTMSLDECCKAAIAAGLNRITITNHLSDKNYFPFRGKLKEWKYNSSLDDLLASKKLVEKARGDYPELKIGFGIEADYEESAESELKGLLDGAGFDFVLGSVHFIEGELILSRRLSASFYDARDKPYFLEAYYSRLTHAVETGFFDCLAHLDVFERGLPDSYRPVELEDYEAHVRRLAREMKKRGTAFELNTASFRKRLTDFHPHAPVRELLKQEGVATVTIGSDAHEGENVGFKCAEARDLAKAEGFETVYYENRKRIPY